MCRNSNALSHDGSSMKTLLSIGGSTYSQAGHFNFVTDAGARATFVSTAITLLEDNGFDGMCVGYRPVDELHLTISAVTLTTSIPRRQTREMGLPR